MTSLDDTPLEERRMAGRRRRRPFRLYGFEIFVAVNLAAIAAYAPEHVLGTLPNGMGIVLGTTGRCIVIGMVVRLIHSAWKKRHRRLLVIYRSRDWWLDTLRIIIAQIFLTQAYAWIKLLVPVINPRLFDEELYALDAALFGGISPSVFFLNVFANPTFLELTGSWYGDVFYGSFVLAISFVLTSPRKHLRLGFITSNAILWLVGAWIYVAVPALGPAFRFPEVWFAYSESLVTPHNLQIILMKNYQNVLRLTQGLPAEPVSLLFGIGAMPSLHVGFQALVGLWARRVWRPGQVVFLTLTAFVFIASMITGWHYMVDGIVGALLAYAGYRIGVAQLDRRRR